ncbi:MAG: chemotaxis protein CheB, partial [Rhodospirillales bacterium]
PKQSLTSISRLLRIDTKVQIIMVSTLNFTNVKAGIEGLERGAAEFLQTPASHTKDSSLAVFQHNLAETVHGLGLARRRAGGRLAKKVPDLTPAQPIRLRKESMLAPKILVIGSSTGGPQALHAVFRTLSKSVTQPILIAQHMPPVFTAVLAKSITDKSGWACKEGEDGEIIQGGHAYIAPGDKHMVIEKDGDETVIRLNQDPPENFCRPSVDPLFRSAVKIFGATTLAAVLTGMGNDGKAGAGAIAEAGGTVIAQDQATSVVWGMPGAVAVAGVCSAVLPLGDIAGYLNQAAGGK